MHGGQARDTDKRRGSLRIVRSVPPRWRSPSSGRLDAPRARRPIRGSAPGKPRATRRALAVEKDMTVHEGTSCRTSTCSPPTRMRSSWERRPIRTISTDTSVTSIPPSSLSTTTRCSSRVGCGTTPSTTGSWCGTRRSSRVCPPGSSSWPANTSRTDCPPRPNFTGRPTSASPTAARGSSTSRTGLPSLRRSSSRR